MTCNDSQGFHHRAIRVLRHTHRPPAHDRAEDVPAWPVLAREVVHTNQHRRSRLDVLPHRPLHLPIHREPNSVDDE